MASMKSFRSFSVVGVAVASDVVSAERDLGAFRSVVSVVTIDVTAVCVGAIDNHREERTGRASLDGGGATTCNRIVRFGGAIDTRRG